MSYPFIGLAFPQVPEAIGKSLQRLLTHALARGKRTAVFWRSRARQRWALSELDDRLLDDIGVDRRSARLEAAKPFWQD